MNRVYFNADTHFGRRAVLHMRSRPFETIEEHDAAQWHDSIQLYGHSHTRLPGNSRSLDVGVDAWNYMPIDIEQIRARMATLTEWKQEEVGPEPEEAADDTGYRG